MSRRALAPVWRFVEPAEPGLTPGGSLGETVTDETLEQTLERKQEMRRQAYDARNAQENKDEISAEAVKRFMALPEYQNAKVAMWYIDCRSETRTKPELLDEVAKAEKKIIVPYCTEDENGENKLGLWHMTSLEEMVVGKWKICLLYTSPSPRDLSTSRMPSSA